VNVIAHKTKFLGIGVPPRATQCPKCGNVIAPESTCFFDDAQWMRTATFFCSEQCLQAGYKLEDKTHHGAAHMIKW
jgi:hypothetical protein